ncbi:Head domain of trimeric autotransporter adhesin [Tenacibaculum sp. 190524A05c]|uniref:Head domain of trimeric autotransporter adhesin n=2 Tax=Tenacibaculum platacis TaxID=3137852 RepID=A0ABM9P5M6_9FLAO
MQSLPVQLLETTITMNKIKTVSLFILLFVMIKGVSQSFNYQGVLRNVTGQVLENQSVGVQFKILQGSANGSNVYQETHSVTTSEFGVIDISVGTGTIISGNFSAINWSSQNYWLEVAVDITGGTTYAVLGSTKLQGVPYASYAATSGDKVFSTTNNVTSNINGNTTTDDFVFGSTQLDARASNSAALDNRMFFDKSKAAFRAGYTPGDEWDEANVGNYSVAFGESAMASGQNSFAMGRNANAIGLESFAFGTNAGGFANYSRGIGVNARANGVNSTAIGRQLNANSMGEIQLGQYSNFVSGSTDSWVATDRLFVIGNGQEDINLALNSDALVMLKNGNTTLNGTLTIDADNKGTGRAFTLPGQDGTANQIMQTDGLGNLSWVTPAASAIPNGGTNGYVLATDGAGVFSWVSNSDLDADPMNEIELPAQTGESGKFLTTDGTSVSWQNVPNELPIGGTSGQVLSTDGSGTYNWVDQSASPIFTTTNNVTSNGNTTYGVDDFIFGAPTNLTGSDVFAANRIFFDKSKAAIRVGRDIGGVNAFADVNVGAYSAAFGLNPKAAGENAFAAGFLANASGRDAVAFGNTSTASGSSSNVIGNNSTASGAYSTAIGRRVTAEAYGQTTLGYYNTGVAGNANGIVETDRLLVVGNGTTDINGINSSDALVMLKNGNTTLNGSLTIDGDNQGSGNSYTLPAQDGAANQIMRTDGSGNVSWATAPTQSVFTTVGNLTSNAGGNTATDDFLFGNHQLASVSGTADDSRMFFDKSKGAFRVGQVTGNQWNDANIGFYSGAIGSNNIAPGSYTFATGLSNVVSGYAASVFGDSNAVAGNGATASGIRLTSESFAQFTIGQWNTAHSGSPDASGWISTDRLFVIGNGTTGSSKSDALVMLKNGNTTLNGSLTIDGDNQGSGTSYTLPAQDGTANQIMTTDGAGNVSWSDAAISGPFSTTANVTSNASGNTATDDFVFGSTQLDDDTNTTDDDSRMFFDKSKGAFRAGRAWGNQWDDANVERWTIAMGNASLAKGIYSVAIGDRNSANFDTSIALGDWVVTDAANSYGLGSHLITNSPLQTSLGVYNTEYTPVAPSSFTEPTNRLLVVGNGTTPSSRSDALVILRNGNTTLNGQLTIDGDNQGSGTSYTLPAQDGTANQVMTTDGAGNTSWTNIPTPALAAYTAAGLNTGAGWENYNTAFSVTTFQDPRYRLNDNVVYLEGMVRKNTAISNGDIIMTLPVGFRPQKTRIFTVQTENGSIRVDVNPSGTVVVATGFNINQNWISLDGITFSID